MAISIFGNDPRIIFILPTPVSLLGTQSCTASVYFWKKEEDICAVFPSFQHFQSKITCTPHPIKKLTWIHNWLCFVALNVLYWVTKATWIKNPTTYSKILSAQLWFSVQFEGLALYYLTSPSSNLFFEKKERVHVQLTCQCYISQQVQ